MMNGTVPVKNPWGGLVSYSRAIRRDNVVYVGGTAATDSDGEVIAPNDVGAQTAHILAEIADALTALGASLADVVNTKVYLTDTRLWQESAAAHAAAFGEHRPTCTMVGVDSLVSPGMVVEMEAMAVLERDA
jgi:enamine deaminase RidA (YjgF/YER057c/UK114 family)